MTRRSLGEFEQMVLLAILQLDDSAYGAQIADELETRAGRSVSRGALYSSLDRLEKKGYLRWDLAPETSERNGQPRRRFEVTRSGMSALRHARHAWLAMSAGLEDLLSDTTS
jgi:DNA-binding PadR family transcriptional regulator